ncbi:MULTISPECIES: SGNH/GDSL hydrolase family protein [Streptomyces]|uniref:G-D-S-L family lipolytic protein n=1 Tax=Streptomyces venezuelae TaxID=54571 RepID=A0A5P2BED5_STRVZ|nr:MULTISPECIES: SGNH/GDSL hydrolase family protein [Streptomyces]NEA02312.1 SGNH/GDSL hydrolase family protein [Streptomyces sp. SID10116]MYY86479.1 SGNH/GDSL hydrolase family protein [Streptomyces sp. SID335]MYZ14049.1 SGNH/GDSL hydrolase family protein [Streptomyces sp. SID337]NDZ84625.1 SGNH/GDSL hydrolase family protein [Streptomyces sp. SID10115]NEB44264.1 SGNH/GDSL hydrolase family protein [Streptomyces sp. SID339]
MISRARTSLATTVTATAAALALTAGLAVTAGAQAVPPSSAHHGVSWTAAWASAPQRPSTGFKPNWSEAGFDDQTLRQVVRVTEGGDGARIRLSNAYGSSPLRIESATIARAGKGAAVEKGSVTRLTFGGESGVTIPARGHLRSDAAGLGLEPFESVTVTLHLSGTTGPATFHAQSFATSYRAAGNHTSDTGGRAFGESTESWYYLSGVDVGSSRAPEKRDGVVLFGDSITDGFASSTDRNRRWSDALAERLDKAGKSQPVLNAGIGGNMVLNDSAWYGEKSANRFSRDALDLPGVGTVVVLEGLNDIGFSETDKPTYKPAPVVSARELIEGHRELIRKARAKGVRVVGATLLPLGGSDHYGKHAAAVSDEFNDWVRTSGEYDAYVDFDRALADPRDPERIAPAYDSGDHLHPNDAGYRAMARAVDLEAL